MEGRKGTDVAKTEEKMEEKKPDSWVVGAVVEDDILGRESWGGWGEGDEKGGSSLDSFQFPPPFSFSAFRLRPIP